MGVCPGRFTRVRLSTQDEKGFLGIVPCEQIARYLLKESHVFLISRCHMVQKCEPRWTGRFWVVHYRGLLLEEFGRVVFLEYASCEVQRSIVDIEQKRL